MQDGNQKHNTSRSSTNTKQTARSLMKNHNPKDKEITKTWKSGQNSTTLVIPKSIAKQSGLDEPCHVIVESMRNGIVVKKIDLEAIL